MLVCRIALLVECSRSSSLLVLVEVRFPQNCVVLISGCCCAALWVEVSVVWLVVVALPSRLRCIAWLPYVLVMFPQNYFVVVLLVAIALSSRLRCIVWLPCVLVMFSQIGLRYAVVVLAGAFWWVFQNGSLVALVEVLLEPVYVAFAGCFLLTAEWMALGAFGGGSPQSYPLRWWDFVCPCGRVVCFASHALCALPDGGLEEASCVPSSSAFRGLLGVVVLSQGIWCRVTHHGDLCGEGPSPCAVLRHWSVCVLLVPRLCLEVLVVVWCVVLSACVVGAVPCVGSGPVWPVLPFLACGFMQVAFGSTVLVLEWFVFMPSGALVHCVALWVAPVCSVFEALSFPPLEHFVLACALWLYHYRSGVAALPCLGNLIGAFGLDFLWLHSRCVSLSDHEDDLGKIEWCRWTLSYVLCRTTRMIWVRSSSAGGHCLARRGFST
ncbi:hypothetical protein Taro_052358 [Colocasia esculenta]|uniref:Uncharacterized protein n=1 Tax=Colocasia esculenta TaxID=4460 RepID=A0A843XJ51_COLES|nr:hypothetical protein [Colocasia esculenta]